MISVLFGIPWVCKGLPLSTSPGDSLVLYHSCVNFPFFPPGFTQVFDINLLHDLASVSDRLSLDLSLTPSVVLVVFWLLRVIRRCASLDLLLDHPGAVLLGSCSWKITFFSFVLRLCSKLAPSGILILKGFFSLRSSLTHLLPRGMKSERLWDAGQWFVSFVD